MKKIVKKCDHCGMKNPKTFPNSKLTVCCSTYDPDNKNAFYSAIDSKGVKVFSIGKVTQQTYQFTFPIVWIGFWN